MHTAITAADTIATNFKQPTYVANSQAWVSVGRTTSVESNLGITKA